MYRVHSLIPSRPNSEFHREMYHEEITIRTAGYETSTEKVSRKWNAVGKVERRRQNSCYCHQCASSGIRTKNQRHARSNLNRTQSLAIIEYPANWRRLTQVLKVIFAYEIRPNSEYLYFEYASAGKVIRNTSS